MKKANHAPEIATSMKAVRGVRESIRSQPKRSVQMGFVDLITPTHSRPEPDTDYDIIPVSSNIIGSIPTPDTQIKLLDLDLYEFYSADLPDFWKSNEGLIKIDVDTKKPQDIQGEEKLATFTTKFLVKDGNYAPSFTYRGVFRNVLIGDWANIGFDLFELDKDSIEYYDKVNSVLGGVPEIKNLDVLKGIPYLDIATKLFDGIIRTFGKNPDDHVWGEIPILEFNPIIGGAFLRNGIYVIIEEDSDTNFDNFKFNNGRIYSQNGNSLSNHLIIGIRIKNYHPA